VVGVEQWAEIRRLYFVKRLSIKEIVRRTGHGRNTIRRALRSGEPPVYRRLPRPSKLDPFRGEIHRLLRSDARLPGKRVRELLEEQGYAGGKTILDDYLREVRPLFLPRPRSFQRTLYRPGALCQFDLWEASRENPGRLRADATRLRRDRLFAVLARRRRLARVLEGGARPFVRHRCVPGEAGRAAGDAGLGSRGGAARRRRPPDRRVRVLLRSARGRLALPRGQGPAVEGRRRAAAGLRRDELRARTTSSSSSTAGSTSGPTCASTVRCAAGRSIGWPKS
jgi:hypothetical protein